MEFREVTTKNIWDVLRLKVHEEQENFVAKNVVSLAEAYATRNEGFIALPYAIYENDVLVGFIMIGKGEDGDPNDTELIKNNFCLWRLMIDKKYQGQGYGTKAIKKALEMMRNDAFGLGKSDYCWLSYEPDNVKGKALYNRLGFIENGDMVGDEIVAVYKF